MGRVVVGVHERHFAANEIGIIQAFGAFERDVRLLLRDQVPRAKLVQRRAAAGRRRLHRHALDHVRRIVVIDDRARFDFFGKHVLVSVEGLASSAESEIHRSCEDSSFWL